MRKGEKRKQAYRMSSKISGLVRSRCFILSFMAVMMICVLSSAPCLELFSAAPLREIQAIFKRNWKINNRHTHTQTHKRIHVICSTPNMPMAGAKPNAIYENETSKEK
jgi:hypothetical protein